jgi:hypothetical protein
MVFTCLIFMAGPYDYTVNIPQPPAQNFLQSLMGIRQLQQMQEQGALQQQQAAIAQQNTAFQKEMQPLQLQAERARIGQIGQSMATSAEALRQGKITFEQAQQDRVRQMEQQAVAQARQQELFGKLNSLPSNASMAEIVPIANQLALIKPEISKQIMDNFSALPEEYQKASKTALITATTQLEAGNIEGAKQTYSTLEQAIKNSAGNNPQLKAMADGIKAQGMILEANPNAGKLAALQMLGSIDTKALDSIVALEKEARTTGVGSQKVIDEEKRALELEKMRLQNKELEQKLQPGAAPISNDQQKDINTLTAEAVDARINVAGATDAVNDLLNFAETNPKEFSKGTAASIDKFFTSAFGDATKAQNLRAAVQPFVTKEWVSKAAGLKGSLSEKEGARLDKGAPDVTKAGPEELLNWLRIVQKVELVDADKKDINAAWQQNARSLQAKAPVEFEVAGIKVKPGDSFQQTLTKVQAGYRKKNQEDILADAVRLKRIQDAQKSGRSPAFGRFDVMGAGPQQQQQPATAPKPRLISIE